MFYKINKVIIIFFSLNISILIFSQQELISKNYFYNIFGGGKEKLFINDNDKIEIESINLNIILNETFADIKAVYKIKNYGNDTIFKFGFPKLDAKVNFVNQVNNKFKKETIKGNYINFSVTINGNPVKYNILEDSDKENIMLPYKIGNQSQNIDSIKSQENLVDAYKFYFSYYIFQVEMKKKDSKSIIISYETPLYYSQITAINLDQNTNPEDPSLDYTLSENGNSKLYESNKIFTYFLNSPNTKENYIIDKIYIKLKANIIDQNFLKIFPVNYKKSGNDYYWKYKKFKASELNNILIKISESYSDKNIPEFDFKSSPEKKVNSYKTFYEINKNIEDITLEYAKNDKISIKKIKISPDYFESFSELKNMNLPLEFEIAFSNNKNFESSEKFYKKLNLKKFLREMDNNSSVQIFESEGIACKFIRIKVLKSSKKDDLVRIRKIQILQ